MTRGLCARRCTDFWRVTCKQCTMSNVCACLLSIWSLLGEGNSETTETWAYSVVNYLTSCRLINIWAWRWRMLTWWCFDDHQSGCLLRVQRSRLGSFAYYFLLLWFVTMFGDRLMINLWLIFWSISTKTNWCLTRYCIVYMWKSLCMLHSQDIEKANLHRDFFFVQKKIDFSIVGKNWFFHCWLLIRNAIRPIFLLIAS